MLKKIFLILIFIAISIISALFLIGIINLDFLNVYQPGTENPYLQYWQTHDISSFGSSYANGLDFEDLVQHTFERKMLFTDFLKWVVIIGYISFVVGFVIKRLRKMTWIVIRNEFHPGFNDERTDTSDKFYRCKLFLKDKRQRRKISRKQLIALIILLTLGIIAIFGFDNRLASVEYKIKSNKIIVDSSVTVLFLADLHNQAFGENQSEFIERIKSYSPDLILLGGDFIYNFEKKNQVINLLQGINGLAPTYYVSGNHEYWSGEILGIKQLMETYGVNVLDDEIANLVIKQNKITLIGIEDPDKKDYFDNNYDQAKSLDNIMKKVKLETSNTFKILLAHRPEKIDMYLKYDFDLILSGHTHGGQVRIPFLVNGFYAPDQGAFPKYAGGRYVFAKQNNGGETSLIVSRGLYNNPKVIRFFNPPELDVIRISGNN